MYKRQREARSVKTPLEIELLRRSAALHARAYSKIPDVYHPGMTDRELSVEVERLMLSLIHILCILFGTLLSELLLVLLPVS